MTSPLVVKFGGDALATPERIAAAAYRVALRRRTSDVVVVASARRGVTDHLLGLVDQVREAVGGTGELPPDARAAADRAVASGELVAASLLAVALGSLGVPAVVLDAREAGLQSDGHAGGATLTRLRLARLQRLRGRGLTPVVTGFQGWHRGRLTTLGRGGSDITAVALADAVGARACELVKDPGALHTADPRLVPDARPIASTTHRFVTEIASAGARVIHHHAAERAEQAGVPLHFTSLQPDGHPATEVIGSGSDAVLDGVYAVVLGVGHRGVAPVAGDTAGIATVTVVSADADASAIRVAARAAAARSGSALIRTVDRPHAVAFLVPSAHGEPLLRSIHAHLGSADRAADQRRRYGGR